MSKKTVISEITIDLNVPPVSRALNSKIIGGFLEYILFFRNLIPFNFQIFNMLVLQKLQKINQATDNDWNTFKIQRQLELAKETINSINKFKEVKIPTYSLSFN